MYVIAQYRFSSSDFADKVLNLLWRKVNGGISREAPSQITIYSNCPDPDQACEICELSSGQKVS